MGTLEQKQSGEGIRFSELHRLSKQKCWGVCMLRKRQDESSDSRLRRILRFWLGKNLERETGFEPATSTLARLHSPTELLPLTEATFYRSILVLSTGVSKKFSLCFCIERIALR